MSEFTEWFPNDVKPVNPGIYQTRGELVNGFAYFDGKKWGSSSPYIEGTMANWNANKHHGAFQKKEWRGLTEKAKD